MSAGITPAAYVRTMLVRWRETQSGSAKGVNVLPLTLPDIRCRFEILHEGKAVSLRSSFCCSVSFLTALLLPNFVSVFMSCPTSDQGTGVRRKLYKG
jgi:hypothetical protein